MKRLLLAIVVIAACAKGKTDEKSAPKLTPAELGTKPVPPGRLAKIKAGMTEAEVKALLPDARPTPNHSGSPSLSIDSGFRDVEYRIAFYSDLGTVASIEVEVPRDFKLTDELKQAWGKPADELGGILEWRNDDDGYRVSVWEQPRHAGLKFTPFTPLTPEFFGKAPAPVGELVKVSWGMSWDQVKAAVPGLEGPQGGSGSYIPFKAKPEGVTLGLIYVDGKVDGMTLTMPARGVALMAKAWGAPKLGKERGGGGEMQCWDAADKSMRVEVATPAADATTTIVSFVQPGRGFCDVP